MRHTNLPACAFVGAFLTLITAFWNWRAGRVPILSLIGWLFTMNVAYGANSLVWSDDAQDRVPVWCDICKRLVLKAVGPIPNLIRSPTATKLIIGASMALPACNLCISKHLAMIGGGRAARLDHRDHRRIAIFDFGFCWGVPAIFMALRKSLVVSPSVMAEELSCPQTTLSRVTDMISSNISAASQQPTFRFLVFSLFISHLYSYHLEALCMRVRFSVSIRSAHL